MSSLKKRATVGMVISMICLTVGVALFRWGNGSYDQSLKAGVANIERISTDDFANSLVAGTVTSILGAGLVAGGIIAFLLTIAVWIGKPQPGSKLTFRGWKAPGEINESEVALDKAVWAALWGFLGTLPWLIPLCLGASPSIYSHSGFSSKIMVLLLIECTVFYIVGIRLCRRRDPNTVAAAPATWRLALVLNYGGLLAFLGFIGTVFFFRFRA